MMRKGAALGGLTAARAGKRVEEWFAWANKRLAVGARAWVRKTEPPVGGRVGRGTTWYKGGAPPDFMGYLAGGRGVCFDLKTSMGPVWRWQSRRGADPREAFRHERTRVRQVTDIYELGQRFGVLAGVIVVLSSAGPQPAALWVPWRKVPLLADGLAWDRERLIEEADAAVADWPAGGDPGWLDAALRSDAKEQIGMAATAAGAFKKAMGEDGKAEA